MAAQILAKAWLEAPGASASSDWLVPPVTSALSFNSFIIRDAVNQDPCIVADLTHWIMVKNS